MGKYWITGTSLIYYWDGSTWTSQTLPGGVGRLWSIHGIDDQNLFAVGQDTTLWYTTNCNPVFLWSNDGGQTWNSEAAQIATDIPTNTGYTFLGVHAFSPTNVWITSHEYFSTQDYYLFHWNGSTFTSKAGIIDPHSTHLWGNNGSNIYLSSPGPNPSTDDYVIWDGASANWPNDITGITKGGIVTGLDSNNVFLIDNVNPHVVAKGYHGGSWSTATLKSGFFTDCEGDHQSKNMDIDQNGVMFIAAYDTTSVAHEVAIGTISGGFVYYTLGASANLTSDIFAAANDDACCVYTKSGGLDQSTWFFNGLSWSPGPDISSMARCFSIYGYSETAPTGTSDDLNEPIGVARNLFLKIHGLEPIFWQWNSRGEPTTYSRSILTCLKPPAEFSVGLNLSEGLPEISAISFKFDDVKDSDTTYYFTKIFAPARWDDNPHCRAANDIEADATSFNVINASTMPDSGLAYIGNETISYTSKSVSGVKGADFLLGVTRDLYPCITDTSLGKYYKFRPEGRSGYMMSIGTVPFTLVGRQVGLYVTTWNKEREQWNSEDDALLVWTGRVSDQLQFDGNIGTWTMSCESLVRDFDTKIVNYDRQVQLANVTNLSGYDKLTRRFTIYIKNMDNVILSKLVVDPSPKLVHWSKWLYNINSLINNPNSIWVGNPPDVDLWFNPFNNRTKISATTTVAFKRKIKFSYDYSQHLFQALGFEVNEDNFFEITTDDVTSVGGATRYETEYISKNEAYEAYQPVDIIEAGSKLPITNSSLLLPEQGDGPDETAAVIIKKVKVGKESVDLYYRYSGSGEASGYFLYDSDYLNISSPDLNYDQYYPRDFYGYRKQDEPTLVRNIYIPYPDELDDPSSPDFGSKRKRGPFEILLMVLMSTGTKNYNGDYDLLPFDYGIGLHQSLINIESFHEADSLIKTKELSYRFFYPIENKTVKDLIKAECIMFGMAITWIDGQFKVVQTIPPPTDKVEKVIDESNIVDPNWQPSFALSTDVIINQYDCSVRFNYLAGKFEAPIVLSDIDSIKALAQTRPVKIEHKGISHMSQMQELNTWLDEQLLSRYLRFPLPVISGVPIAPNEINQIYVGEVIQFISDKCPDPFGSGTKNTNSYALLTNLSWNYVTWIGQATFILLSAAQSYGASMSATAINDLDASNGGWNSGAYQMTLEPWEFGKENEDPKDGQRYRAGDYIKITERAPADPDNPVNWGPFEVAKDFEADGTDILTLATGTTLAGWDNTEEYVIIPADYTFVASNQQADIFIADPSEFIDLDRFGYLIG